MTATTTRTTPDQTDSLLRLALRLDATLTGICGLAVAAFAGPLAELTGLTSTITYVLGAALVLYGVVVYGLAGLRLLRRAGIGVMIANLVCTVGAVLVVVEGLAPLTGVGVAVALASAVYTTFFAAWQYLGVRRLA
ncbi:hypothetical protein [Mycolicibacterium confluentis]|uniref:Uncharacterized protein n=1 Tax=Mycolicibacterium confluentis TaxID=28047 RepID=A0A7I7XSF0_9MYCO|nr:hypothetical protein [Mycolicibacterium confluentis]MCV7321363.1 hypothetical protein [Mycolicibacterium confluentis]ORV25175.1 hypothetical protein AWB99_22020 [Mycolicibacterium confluentis]BBZ32155.1 hypothetical protein MCNF_07600 [Mycolicibacterium confluentis]